MLLPRRKFLAAASGVIAAPFVITRARAFDPLAGVVAQQGQQAPPSISPVQFIASENVGPAETATSFTNDYFVPSDAETALFVGIRFRGNGLTNVTLGSGGGQLSFRIVLNEVDAETSELVYYAAVIDDVTSLAGGTETLTVNWDLTSTFNAYDRLVFFKNTNTSEAIDMTNKPPVRSNRTSAGEDITLVVNSSVNDMSYFYCELYQNVPDIQSGFTQDTANVTNNVRSRGAYKASGSPTTSGTVTTDSFPNGVMVNIVAG